jgi:FtsH-binding integral membrane protein
VLALLSAFAVGVMTVAPEKKSFVADDFPQARDHFGVLPRTLAAVGSGIPALIIIGLAVWSLSRLLQRRVRQDADNASSSGANRLVMSNVLVAVATLVLSASGSLAGRLGEEQAFAVTLSVGVVILFVGFMVPSVRSAQRAA